MKLHEAIAVTYAAMGQEVPDAALKVMVADLKPYPIDGVLHALSRCRKELKRVALADIIERIPGGHPEPDEAWAMVASALDNESATVVWTDPMREAFFVTKALADDPIAARMAFKEAYRTAVALARESDAPIQWQASLGHDPHGREPVLAEAVRQGRLTAEYVMILLPHREEPALLNQIAGMKLLTEKGVQQ